MDFEIPNWEEIEGYIRELALKISDSKNNFDAIVCIWRGGACPSRLLSDFLNIDTIYNITIKYYEDIQQQKVKPIIIQQMQTDLTGKNILIIDDVSDSGDSLIAAKNFCEIQKCASITTATIYIKSWTKFIPDFYVKKTEAWIIFPWECIEMLEKLTQKNLIEGKDLEEIKHELLSMGFKKAQVEFYFSMRQYLRKQHNIFNST